MPQLIPFGPPTVMATNVIYATPGGAKASVFCGDATPTIEQSNVQDFATKSAVTFTGGLGTVVGAFIRATAGTPTVVLMRD
jgi:hypothetical protein